MPKVEIKPEAAKMDNNEEEKILISATKTSSTSDSDFKEIVTKVLSDLQQDASSKLEQNLFHLILNTNDDSSLIDLYKHYETNHQNEKIERLKIGLKGMLNTLLDKQRAEKIAIAFKIDRV